MKFVAYSLAAFLAASSAFAASKAAPAVPACSYKIGDQATFIKPADYLSVAKANQQKLGAEKGEFETTKDYNNRVAAAQKSLAIKPVLLEHPADYDKPDSGVTYIADEQHFRFFVGAFIGMLTGFDYRYMDKVVLQQTQKSMDSYVASNAYGNQKSVERSVWDLIAIKSWKTFPKSIYWKLPKKDNEEGYSVYIPVPLEQAKTFRIGLKAGIEFLPKPPYFSTDTDRVHPKMDWPIDITYNVEQFDGVVLCAVIADKDGKVVKTVQPLIQ
ncbi:hypothetical protein SAMN05216228_10492 [Rhizobium tibeticum]|uniref:Uncharacterized protein n=1 Tax=Rhizobium tibeticum TaxID=501024 RepID=A0A1H8VXQ0_9HYPH|nr:hypothetical protein [Rhizobium tibeticum]SEI19809.1 hypothetical protein RTCCBAU85039_6246 [Rhizobium tibeticum]SEP20125.1 hypothetical protein SAMN05216228_10492 [Rhizobium tibeticum]